MIFNNEELNALSGTLNVPLDDLIEKVESITEVISNPKKYNFINRSDAERHMVKEK